jgi:hypothetical protein
MGDGDLAVVAVERAEVGLLAVLDEFGVIEESLDADLQAVAEELEELVLPTAERQAKQQPKRRPLPAYLPRREIRHDPDSTTCSCGSPAKRRCAA